MKKIKISSRSTTPWTKTEDSSKLQQIIDRKNKELYNNRHPSIKNSGEVDVLNSFYPKKCPYCSSKSFTKAGTDKNGIQRYICKNHDVHESNKTFTITTNTIFDSHKIPLSEWVDFCLALFRQQSFNTISKGERNSYNTTKYWSDKVFLLVRTYQSHTILKGTVYLDETFYSVEKRDLKIKDGRQSASNKFCIGIACDENKHVYCAIERMSSSSNHATYKTFKDHIQKKSILIHDKTKFHKKLVDELNLNSIAYDSELIKEKKGKYNPLYPINRRCFELKTFLNHHCGFKRSQLNDYLNLYCFIYNTPFDPFEKVNILLELAFSNPQLYRYRDVFPTIK